MASKSYINAKTSFMYYKCNNDFLLNKNKIRLEISKSYLMCVDSDKKMRKINYYNIRKLTLLKPIYNNPGFILLSHIQNMSDNAFDIIFRIKKICKKESIHKKKLLLERFKITKFFLSLKIMSKFYEFRFLKKINFSICFNHLSLRGSYLDRQVYLFISKEFVHSMTTIMSTDYLLRNIKVIIIERFSYSTSSIDVVFIYFDRKIRIKNFYGINKKNISKLNTIAISLQIKIFYLQFNICWRNLITRFKIDGLFKFLNHIKLFGPIIIPFNKD
mmetsp:Transcript_20454/g.32979  ORF Transcript_20454/g.32979 Transcript_20454/m.32979 type:complete len:273 (-) Transcript_20454:2305-3123(-)